MDNSQQSSSRQNLPSSSSNFMQDNSASHHDRYRKRNQLQNTLHQNPPPGTPPVRHPRVQQLILEDARYTYGPRRRRSSERTVALEMNNSNDHRSLTHSSLNGAPQLNVQLLHEHTSLGSALSSGAATARREPLVDIESLFSYKFNADTHKGDQTTCVICMCDFEACELLTELPCSHKFHAECVNRWFMSSRKCPICRRFAQSLYIRRLELNQ